MERADLSIDICIVVIVCSYMYILISIVQEKTMDYSLVVPVMHCLGIGLIISLGLMTVSHQSLPLVP